MRLEDVQIVSVEYAVAAKLGRKLADGYHTLRITAAVDAATAAGVGNLLVATAAPVRVHTARSSRPHLSQGTNSKA